MEIAEALDKYNKVVDNYKLDENELNDIALAICIADKYKGSNVLELSVDRLVNSELGFVGVGSETADTRKLPRVQCLRVLCDVLTIALRGVAPQMDVQLTCKASAYVGKTLGKHIDCCDYADESVCDSILNAWEKTCVSREQKEIFEFTEKMLRRIKRMDDAFNHALRYNKDFFKHIYLPDEYDSSGYEVSRDLPKALAQVHPTSFDELLEFWELRGFMDVLISFMVGDEKMINSDLALSLKLIYITEKLDSYIPIAIGGTSGIRGEIYEPSVLSRNDAMRQVYDSIFSKNMVLERQSLDTLIKFLYLFEKKDEEGIAE